MTLPTIEAQNAPVAPSVAPRRLLKIEQVREMTGLSTSFIYDKMNEGEFPAAVRLAKGIAVAWREDEVQAWIDSRPRATRPGVKIWKPPAAVAGDVVPEDEAAAADAPRLSKNGKRLGRRPKG